MSSICFSLFLFSLYFFFPYSSGTSQFITLYSLFSLGSVLPFTQHISFLLLPFSFFSCFHMAEHNCYPLHVAILPYYGGSLLVCVAPLTRCAPLALGAGSGRAFALVGPAGSGLWWMGDILQPIAARARTRSLARTYIYICSLSLAGFSNSCLR